MDYHGRRNRRRRNRSRAVRPWIDHRQKCSIINQICSFLVVTSLITIVILMLKHHCNICSKKYDFYKIARSIDDISHNITKMKNSYHDLENNVRRFSYELPKMEGQVEILEALAHTMETRDFIWNPKFHIALPNVDVHTRSMVYKRDKGNITHRRNFTSAD